MSDVTPHYLLLTATDGGGDQEEGRWHFLLHRLDRVEVATEAGDVERGLCRQRLELLAVVRGLEALHQPSRVTLVAEDPYVVRGIRFGLQEWKAHGWRWERFGRWVSVKHADLWRRLERAMQFHLVRGRHNRFRVSPEESGGDARRSWRQSMAISARTSLRPIIPAIVRRLQGLPVPATARSSQTG